MKLTKKITILIIGISIVFTACSTTTKKQKQNKAWLFSYFNNNGKDGLHLAYTRDGLTWKALNNDKSFLHPTVGKDSLMRDPSVARGKDGTFHMVWTSGWWDKGIGYASSKDLIHWSNQQNIPVMENFKSTKNAWAPEIFYDNKSDLFYIFWASTVPDLYEEIETTKNEKGLNHRLYYTTTNDFKTFSPTKLFFDPGFSVIDGAILKTDSAYMMVIKNEMSVPAEKNLRLTFTKDLSKGFPTKVSESISGKDWAEGPTPVKIGEYTYIYFDKYHNHKYGAIRTLDGKVWEDISDSINMPRGIRHGTAFPVDEKTLEKLIQYKMN